jgi:hypothetical protein
MAKQDELARGETDVHLILVMAQDLHPDTPPRHPKSQEPGRPACNPLQPAAFAQKARESQGG